VKNKIRQALGEIFIPVVGRSVVQLNRKLWFSKESSGKEIIGNVEWR